MLVTGYLVASATGNLVATGKFVGKLLLPFVGNADGSFVSGSDLAEGYAVGDRTGNSVPVLTGKSVATGNLVAFDAVGNVVLSGSDLAEGYIVGARTGNSVLTLTGKSVGNFVAFDVI